MVAEFTTDDWTAALDETATGILQAAGIGEPPVDAIRLAAALEIDVAWDDRQTGRAHIVRLDDRAGGGRAAILLRPEPRPERRQWAVAHEVGEAFASGFFAQLSLDPDAAPSNLRERVANQLASRILLPSEWFHARAIACEWDLLALKTDFATASHELIAARMLDFLTPVIITLLDNGKLTWRRSNIAGRAPPMSEAEKQAWQRARKNQIDRSPDGSIQAWPIHEPPWKREIIRRAVSEWQDFD